MRLVEPDASPCTYTGGPEEKARTYTHYACWVPWATALNAAPAYPIPKHEFLVEAQGPAFPFTVSFGACFDGPACWAAPPALQLPWNEPEVAHHLSGEEVLRCVETLQVLHAADRLNVLDLQKERGLEQDVVATLQLSEGDLRVYPLPKQASRWSLQLALRGLGKAFRSETAADGELRYYRSDWAELAEVQVSTVQQLPDDNAPSESMLPRMRASLLGHHLEVRTPVEEALRSLEQALAEL